ncbi:DNA recombination protein RmuC, partial [Rhizobium sp. BR5]
MIFRIIGNLLDLIMSIDFSVLLEPALRAGSVDISFGALLAALVFG